MSLNRVYIKTFGCQMNEHDSRAMHQLLSSTGYSFTDEINNAEIIILNTCSVRSGPENKIYSFLGRLRPLKKAKPHLIIGVGGCVAQQEKENILKRIKYVDLVFGPDNITKLPELITKAKDGQRSLAVEWNKQALELNSLAGDNRQIENAHAYIAITKGCDNFCSYCIVPFTRGREVSRSATNIVAEARNLIERGAKEIMLVGQNVNSYQHEQIDFYKLLKLLADLPDLQRLRFISPHPKDWNNELSELLAAKKTICNQLHLPFQSGASRILELMRRDHNIENYLQKIDYIKKLIPEISLSTDIIVGFPSETEAEFEQTLAVLKSVEYSQVYAYKYTPRPATKAANLIDDVPLAEKEMRLNRLFLIQAEIQKNNFKKLLNSTQQVLISDVSTTQSSGKIEANITTNINQQLILGQFYPVRITANYKNSLLAELV